MTSIDFPVVFVSSKSPAAHAMHCSSAVRLVVLPHFPVLHEPGHASASLLCPAMEPNFPRGHVESAHSGGLLAGLYMPGSQDVHAVRPARPRVSSPAPQKRHVLLARYRPTGHPDADATQTLSSMIMPAVAQSAPDTAHMVVASSLFAAQQHKRVWESIFAAQVDDDDGEE